ncbi:F0F1 ATP synthase subunit delta [Peribacillus huizhouensis]|uniref:ATP synthase subunit delta n=1 Tax=Peribacillus huizhouensis TaxID=1501239 RepID=A0ABR6CTF0_9BACI|nr:F0F1 ATP synthase subunit delta [Peribacillus huizhouensis]MBA9027870.1 F-type H+-transporting ATPase subunit delta [Peribacillus huizhouensis]
MSDVAVAKRYSRALFQIAQEQNLLDQLEEELTAVREVFNSDKELLAFLTQPKIPVKSKKDVITQSFSSVSRHVQNTLLIMVERHRTDSIAQMALEFIELANEAKSVAEATVYTVRPLSDHESEAVSSVFAAKVGKRTLKITNIADKSILGGIKLRIGNRIFDGSVNGKLERLSRQLLS